VPEVAVEAPPEPSVDLGVPNELHGLALAFTDDELTALRNRTWATVADHQARPHKADTAEQAAARAFLVAWAFVRADQPAKAADWIARVGDSTLVPAGYLRWTKAEVARAAGNEADAVALLEQVGEGSVLSPLAALTRARVARAAGDTDAAVALLERIIANYGGDTAGADAMLELAAVRAADKAAAYPLLRRVWTEFPRSEQAVAAAKALEPFTDAKYRPTWQEVAQRAERLMNQRDYAGAVRELERVMAAASDQSEDACRARFVLGRSKYRMNQLTPAVAAFGDAGARCKDAPGDYGAKSLYLQGTALFRKGAYAEATKAFAALPDTYPASSFADDGLLHAGIAQQEAGDLKAAQALWGRALKDFATGDTVPESTWRLAWSHYLDGNTDEAIVQAEALGRLPLDQGAVDVAAGRYWAARWALYPDVANPNKAVEDHARREAAIAGFAAICRELPWSYYALLAHARLMTLSPELAAELDAARPARATEVPWVVRRAVFEDPHAGNAVQLARLGLIAEARDEWSRRALTDATPDEYAWFTELRTQAGDWLIAHEQMRAWLLEHPIGTLGPREAQVVRTAYPLRYWENVSVAAKDDRYDPWLLQALMREESNFNRNVVSHAGAIGLSQLMPATAKQVAGWLGISITNESLKDPQTNLDIGARYLDSLHKQQHGSPFLSLAAYNAGAGRVSEWIGRFGNVPTDEYVEDIPFRETRGYVKRVTGTWQTYRWFYGEGAAFPPLEGLIPQALADE